MNDQSNTITPEFSSLYVEEHDNPYRDCIQGLANEPITVHALLKRADALLSDEAGFAGLSDFSQQKIVERLTTNRPRICIIFGSPDHPAHLYDQEHTLRAAARIWQNGGVPFAFGLPVICDGTAQSNIGQSYSLASRNHTAMAVNVNFEGHSYHAAYVLSGCDKTPTAFSLAWPRPTAHAGHQSAARRRYGPSLFRRTYSRVARFPRAPARNSESSRKKRARRAMNNWPTTSKKTAATFCNVPPTKLFSACSTVPSSMA